MDSIEALEKVYDSLSCGASVLDFSPSDISGECAVQVQEIVRLRKAGAVTEDALNGALSCLNNGNGLSNLGLISAGLGYWNCSIKAYDKALLIFEKLGDVHGKGITLSYSGKLYLDKVPQEPDTALKYLEESIKLINKEARPDYPDALNWLAYCCHRLGCMRKTQAKREKDHKRRVELVSTAALFFSEASLLYNQVASILGIAHPSLQVYSHLDKGLSYSVKNITEKEERKTIALLDNALNEFKKGLKFADEKEKASLLIFIREHEAKRYIRLTAISKNSGKQNAMLNKAIEALTDAASKFEGAGDECSIEGSVHLSKGLKLFREGINDRTKKNKALSDSFFELIEARKCYEKAEIGADTIEVLKNSFKFVEEGMKSNDEMVSIAHEFNKIIEDLSDAGLQKMVKMHTFDESNLKKEGFGKNDINLKVSIPERSDSWHDKLSNPLAGFFGLTGGLVFMIYGFFQSSAIPLIIGIIVFIILAAFKLYKK